MDDNDTTQEQWKTIVDLQHTLSEDQQEAFSLATTKIEEIRQKRRELDRLLDPDGVDDDPDTKEHCVTLCNVVTERQKRNYAWESVTCNIDMCSSFPVVGVGKTCTVKLIDSCCEVHQGTVIPGLKYDQIKATFMITIPTKVQTPSGVIEIPCIEQVTVPFYGTFLTCEIKDCHVVNGYGHCYDIHVVDERTVAADILFVVVVKACIMTERVRVKLCPVE